MLDIGRRSGYNKRATKNGLRESENALQTSYCALIAPAQSLFFVAKIGHSWAGAMRL